VKKVVIASSTAALIHLRQKSLAARLSAPRRNSPLEAARFLRSFQSYRRADR
jgi:hypothetical protein